MVKRGRPSKFSEKMVTRILFLAAKGLIEDEIAETLGISPSTLDKWKKSPTFLRSLNESKSVVDDKVHSALLSKALGYRTTFLKNFVVSDGKDSGAHVEQHQEEVVYPPDTTACIFWLKNRRPKEWREKLPEDEGAKDYSKTLIQIFQPAREEEKRLIDRGADPIETLLGKDFVDEIKKNGNNGHSNGSIPSA